MNNAEVLARRLLHRALKENPAAMEMVIDRVEGKAVRAAQVAQQDTTLDDQLTRLDEQTLDALAGVELKKETPP